mmetsp:Transcript_7679/g.25440  ORF Transcript_7679/g.25440 Transcript_7679/m.25440 type:complete len:312 (+) Transcript_7679:52-987(+)|eukprot:CAMPEP_0170134676 /NCGR_PEP_ID=MMETSP0033_2-20121228/2043_1 /TAXON_ID=195969 /ORGANISM="Dolichomastix tenuilepis, Strain CCMP3274" /LENGTH=311 /DNA_ID=CAMNT_0010370245 /DNA_START=41 /DNA_END=976 /DNA_ORIENTATION=-
MSNKYGNFSEPSYISLGDPYGKRIEENSRNTGLNMKAAVDKTGKTNDATFSKFVPLYMGEKYEADYKEKREHASTKKKLMVSETPFKPSKPGTKSSGLGNYYGCVGPKLAHMKDSDESAKKKGDFASGPRNIVTNPSKQGTFGYRGTTLGEKLGAGGAIGEYQYKPDAYENKRKVEVAESKKSIEMRVTDKPFKPTSPPKRGGAGVPGRTLGGRGGGVCGEYTYKMEGPSKPEAGEALERPFRPSHPPKEGYNSTLNKFPAYQEDPLDLKIKKEKAARKAEIERMNAQPKFVPPSTMKSGATVSVLRKNLM